MRHDFVASVVRSLWFQVGAFGLAFLLMFILPAGAGRQETTPAGERDATPAVAAAS